LPRVSNEDLSAQRVTAQPRSEIRAAHLSEGHDHELLQPSAPILCRRRPACKESIAASARRGRRSHVALTPRRSPSAWPLGLTCGNRIVHFDDKGSHAGGLRSAPPRTRTVGEARMRNPPIPRRWVAATSCSRRRSIARTCPPMSPRYAEMSHRKDRALFAGRDRYLSMAAQRVLPYLSFAKALGCKNYSRSI
jgi:hypothetical protein